MCIRDRYNTTPYDKLKLDLFYIENYSLWTDIKLILMTVKTVLKKDATEGVSDAVSYTHLKICALHKLVNVQKGTEKRMT